MANAPHPSQSSDVWPRARDEVDGFPDRLDGIRYARTMELTYSCATLRAIKLAVLAGYDAAAIQEAADLHDDIFLQTVGAAMTMPD